MTIRALFAITAISLVLPSCSSDEKSAAEYAEEQAAKLKKEKQAELPKLEKVKVPVMGGKRIECSDLLTDIDAFSAVLPNPVVLHQLDKVAQTKRQPGVNAICELVREGTPPTLEEQKKMKEKGKTERLGTLPGSAYCEIRVDCGRPMADDFESQCRKMMNHSGNRDLGIFACVMQSQRAERDAFRFKFYEPDTKCFIDVLAGHSEVGMEIPTACSKLAMEQITAASIEKYRD
jgi:hypothetical protein